eukprot:CAMPEP_0179265010 /NCGR_PEP_ID=MMETSP0797-20121207/28683_1 /TAXON_ID=47934 /ORGANISM="Dinophysis acuminata, Strain DAEP01" /LENGTH=250 /DNA_ID=CAMNT_0020973205 /DNA_START=35 /DNA_END=785 /DNA_ORIENTATION=-
MKPHLVLRACKGRGEPSRAARCERRAEQTQHAAVRAVGVLLSGEVHRRLPPAVPPLRVGALLEEELDDVLVARLGRAVQWEGRVHERAFPGVHFVETVLRQEAFDRGLLAQLLRLGFVQVGVLGLLLPASRLLPQPLALPLPCLLYFRSAALLRLGALPLAPPGLLFPPGIPLGLQLLLLFPPRFQLGEQQQLVGELVASTACFVDDRLILMVSTSASLFAQAQKGLIIAGDPARGAGAGASPEQKTIGP